MLSVSASLPNTGVEVILMLRPELKRMKNDTRPYLPHQPHNFLNTKALVITRAEGVGFVIDCFITRFCIFLVDSISYPFGLLLSVSYGIGSGETKDDTLLTYFRHCFTSPS